MLKSYSYNYEVFLPNSINSLNPSANFVVLRKSKYAIKSLHKKKLAIAVNGILLYTYLNSNFNKYIFYLQHMINSPAQLCETAITS